MDSSNSSTYEYRSIYPLHVYRYVNCARIEEMTKHDIVNVQKIKWTASVLAPEQK